MSPTIAVVIGGVLEIVKTGLDEAQQRARDGGGYVWVGLSRGDAEAVRTVGARLAVATEPLERCLQGHQRSLLARHGDHVLIVLQPSRYLDESERVETTELAIVVGDDHVITVEGEPWVGVADERSRLAKRPALLRKGPEAVAWALCEATLSAYRPVLEGVENDIDEIEEQLFSEDAGVSHRIFALQRTVIALQHATGPLVEMMSTLREVERSSVVTGHSATRGTGRDLDGAAQHVADRVDGFRHTLESALSVHSTMVEQRNNESMRAMTELSLTQSDQMKKISSWAAILFAPTLVASIYGMNFHVMPELSWRFGYPMALGLMLLLGLVLYLVFKKKDWL